MKMIKIQHQTMSKSIRTCAALKCLRNIAIKLSRIRQRLPLTHYIIRWEEEMFYYRIVMCMLVCVCVRCCSWCSSCSCCLPPCFITWKQIGAKNIESAPKATTTSSHLHVPEFNLWVLCSISLRNKRRRKKID